MERPGAAVARPGQVATPKPAQITRPRPPKVRMSEEVADRDRDGQ